MEEGSRQLHRLVQPASRSANTKAMPSPEERRGGGKGEGVQSQLCRGTALWVQAWTEIERLRSAVSYTATPPRLTGQGAVWSRADIPHLQTVFTSLFLT